MTRRRLVLLTICLALASVVSASATQDPPQRAVFSSRVEAIRLDVLVTRDNHAVRDLKSSDFEVLDNGVPQTVDLLSFDQIPLNLVMVLDMSSSLTGERLAQLRSAGGQLVASLKKGDQAALLSFAEMVRLDSRLTTDLQQIRTTVEGVKSPGIVLATALVDALYSGVMVADADVGRTLVVVFSDGVDTASWLKAAEAINAAKRSDATVYGVTTAHHGRATFLADVTDATGGSLFEVESTKDLGAAFLAVLDEFRGRYLLSYSPTGPAKHGWHDVVVKVKRRDLKVKARPGYWAE
jgi:VWFA-related protein